MLESRVKMKERERNETLALTKKREGLAEVTRPDANVTFFEGEVREEEEEEEEMK